MALDFPTSPIDGQTYGNYYYDGIAAVWRAKPLSSNVASTGTTPPASPKSGDLWYNTNDGTLFVYYYDSNSYQWVEVKANSTLGTTVADRVTAIENTRPNINYIINGGFDIWQRGTATVTGIVNTAFHPDRWLVITDAVGNVNSSRIDVSSQGIGSQYGWRLERTSGTNRWVAIQMVEGASSLVGKSVTLSLYLRKGSALTSNITLDISTRTTKFGTGYDYTSYVVQNSALNTSTFTRFSVTLPITTATSSAGADLFEIEINASQVGASGAYFDIAGVQLEVGANATPFHRNANSLQGELAACQRYYWKLGYETNPIGYNFGPIAWGRGGSANTWITYPTPVPMRTVPTTTQSGTITSEAWDGTNVAHPSIANQYSTARNIGLILNRSSGTWGGGTGLMIGFTSSSGYLEHSAEL